MCSFCSGVILVGSRLRKVCRRASKWRMRELSRSIASRASGLAAYVLQEVGSGDLVMGVSVVMRVES